MRDCTAEEAHPCCWRQSLLTAVQCDLASVQIPDAAILPPGFVDKVALVTSKSQCSPARQREYAAFCFGAKQGVADPARILGEMDR